MSELSAKLTSRINQSNDPILHFNHHFFTGAEIGGQIAVIQHALQTMRVAKGDRVLIAEHNSYAYVVTHLAILLYGAVVVPVNPAMPAPEMHKVLERAEVAGAFVNPGLLSYFSDENGKLVAASVRFVGTIESTKNAHFAFSLYSRETGSPQLRRWTEKDAQPVFVMETEVAEDTGAILLFTSGTTGTPKGVLLTHRQVMATARNVAEAHKLTARDVCYSFLPLFHINAQVVGMISTLMTGGRIILEAKFSASRFWETVVQHQVTWISAVPTVIAILIKSPGAANGMHRVRFVRSASAPLPSLHARRFEARFSIPIVESYGLTEAASQVCVNPVPPGLRKLGSAGLPCGVELHVVSENGAPLPSGEVGEIVIRGASVISAYAYGDSSGTSFRNGFFHTGDLGYVDEDGYVFITGRSKEMINRAGQKISPREVEEVIGKHSGVKAVAVIGLPDDMYGERVVAYVIPDHPGQKGNPLFKEQLRALCLSSVSAYKCPAEFHLVDEIPLGPTGKIQRHRLREQALASGYSG